MVWGFPYFLQFRDILQSQLEKHSEADRNRVSGGSGGCPSWEIKMHNSTCPQTFGITAGALNIKYEKNITIIRVSHSPVWFHISDTF